MKSKNQSFLPNGKPICNCGHCKEIENQIERCKEWREINEFSTSNAYR